MNSDPGPSEVARQLSRPPKPTPNPRAGGTCDPIPLRARKLDQGRTAPSRLKTAVNLPIDPLGWRITMVSEGDADSPEGIHMARAFQARSMIGCDSSGARRLIVTHPFQTV